MRALKQILLVIAVCFVVSSRADPCLGKNEGDECKDAFGKVGKCGRDFRKQLVCKFERANPCANKQDNDPCQVASTKGFCYENKCITAPCGGNKRAGDDCIAEKPSKCIAISGSLQCKPFLDTKKGVLQGEMVKLCNDPSDTGDKHFEKIVEKGFVQVDFENEGPYALFGLSGESSSEYKKEDAQFKKALGSKTPKDVIVAVLDAGVYSSPDEKSDTYLSKHVIKHFYAFDVSDPKEIFECGKSGSAPNEGNGGPWGFLECTKEGVDLKDVKMSDNHGTRVAAVAAFGSPNIKILDYATNTGGNPSPATLLAILKHAKAQGANIVTSSVSLPWTGKPAIKYDPSKKVELPDLSVEMGKFLDESTDMLFLATTSNLPLSVWDAFPDERPNLMVGGGAGVLYDLDVAYVHHMRPFHAKKISLQVPGACTPLYQNEVNAIVESLRNGGTVSVTVAQLKQEVAKLAFTERYKEKTTHDDTGVSFGLPMLANVAAKVEMLCPGKPAAWRKKIIMMSTTAKQSEKNPFKGRSQAEGFLLPSLAYRNAVKLCNHDLRTRTTDDIPSKKTLQHKLTPKAHEV